MRPLDLLAVARRLMHDAGFEPDFGAAVAAEARRAVPPTTDGVRDLRTMLWSSIDNHTSRDLDQVEWAERLGPDRARLMIGLADVDALAPIGSGLDGHASVNTTSVYLGVATFPMLPVPLSEGLTSLLEGEDRLAIVVEMVVTAAGEVENPQLHRALVRNHAKLTYEEIGRFLDGEGPPPANPDLEAQIRLQDEIGRWLKGARQQRGALTLETIEAHPVVSDGKVVNLELTRKSRAREIIEDFMLAANAAIAGFFEARDTSWIRRMVRAPKRWERIVELAAGLGETLPAIPNAPALATFLSRRRATDPTRFVELSLSVVKLLGPGIYVLERAGEDLEGHFGLAVQDYTHSTAPNRRYADLVTQRLLKAALAGLPVPYDDGQLGAIADRCTHMEDGARKVERRMRKVAAAAMLAPRVGETFEAVITGAKPDGTYARLLQPPAEGRVVRGEAGLDVGDRVKVRLIGTDPDRGFIDFVLQAGP